MDIKLSCNYQNTRLKYDKFPVFSISRVVEATVTASLPRARHCAADNGSRTEAGPHGMVCGASNEIGLTDFGKPAFEMATSQAMFKPQT